MNPNPIGDITTILTFIILVSNFILMLMMWVDKAKTPEKTQNERITALEAKVEDIYNKMVKDNDRIKELEKGNVVTQEALLALMSHAIDGNHTDELEKARNDLHDYLTHKGVKLQ